MSDTEKGATARKSERLTKIEETDLKKTEKKVKDKDKVQQMKDYALPTPLQVEEKLQGQSTPKNLFSKTKVPLTMESVKWRSQ